MQGWEQEQGKERVAEEGQMTRQQGVIAGVGEV